MRKIEPTHIEIMMYLNCVHYGWGCDRCICTSPYMFRGCYEKAKERLTRTEYTEEEIEQQKKNNEIAMQELHSFFEEFDLFDY